MSDTTNNLNTTGTTTNPDYFKKLQEMADQWNKPHQSVCPSCGHCPTCGRGGYWSRPYQPYYPYQPYITWTSGTSAGWTNDSILFKSSLTDQNNP